MAAVGGTGAPQLREEMVRVLTSLLPLGDFLLTIRKVDLKYQCFENFLIAVYSLVKLGSEPQTDALNWQKNQNIQWFSQKP